MTSLRNLLFALPVLVAAGSVQEPSGQKPVDPDIVATFSIVAFDPETGDLGVAVASRYLAVGAIATQAAANVTFGPRGLELLARGVSTEDTMQTLLDSDEGRASRQLAIIDAKGNVRTFTGESCSDWAGGIAGKNYAVQGNILTGEDVVKAMSEAFESTEGDLGEKMLAAMDAGDAAGGDSRGRQSASILVVREGGGFRGLNDRYRDYRVDDHPTPLVELRRIYNLGNRRGRRRGR